MSTYATALKVAVRGSTPRSIVRRPLERHADGLLNGRPGVDLSDLTGAVTFQAQLGGPDERHAWSLHASDQFILQSLIAARGIRTAFEIGTFNGGTTRVIAESLPEDGQMWTLDLPSSEFDRTQSPDQFSGGDVGREYRSSPAAAKITQLLEDSTSFSADPYASKCDLVLVDGAHDYPHGYQDTLTAFDLVSPGGIIVWDDFTSYWHGLIRGIYDAAGSRAPRRLAGSNLGVWTASLER